MVEDCKLVLKVSGIYITTVIGAGFASGREIVQFFSGYYCGGFYGIVFAGILFATIGGFVLDRVYSERIRSYEEFIYPLIGYRVGEIFDLFGTFFMLCLYIVMMAGLTNITIRFTGFSFLFCIIPLSFLSMLFILKGIKGVVAVSAFLTPMLLIGITLIGFYIIVTRDTAAFSSGGLTGLVTGNWFFSSLLYVGYNSIMAVMILCGLHPYLKKRKIAIIAGILGGCALCFMAFLLNTALSFFYPAILKEEMPVLFIIQKYSSTLCLVYSLILWAAMFISAITSGFCFVERLSKKIKVDMRMLTVIVCIITIPLPGMGFSNLIARIYPVFGYVGLFLVLVILVQAAISLTRKQGLNRRFCRNR